MGINMITLENITQEQAQYVVCVYCEKFIAEQVDYTQTQFCADCNEYKSMSTLADYLADFGGSWQR
jgi:hypothetical protein